MSQYTEDYIKEKLTKELEAAHVVSSLAYFVSSFSELGEMHENYLAKFQNLIFVLKKGREMLV